MQKCKMNEYLFETYGGNNAYLYVKKIFQRHLHVSVKFYCLTN